MKKILQKIKCWLGWHEWEESCPIDYCQIHIRYDVDCRKCDFWKIVCKHCGKVKK